MPSITDSQGPTRGERDVTLETDVVEDDDAVEYVPAENAVRYVARRRHTNGEEIRDGEPPEREPVYETRPFDEWARTQCLTAAAGASADHVEAELGADGVGGGITSGVDGKEVAAFVSISTTLDRDGEALSQPSIAFDELVAATPSTVHVTYRLADQAYQTDAAVYAVHRVARQE